MPTHTDEEKQKILKSLEEYYALTPKQFSLGLQNFQSIREYTKIPLAPITLIYGQNSAGKSAIHDALIFLSAYLDDSYNDSATFDSYLEKWASHQRKNRPLKTGYIGKPDDVVIGIDTWASYASFDFPNYPEESSLISNVLHCKGLSQPSFNSKFFSQT